MQLTPIQDKAVKHLGKNLLVSAGAGSGKTRVLVERFLHLVTTRQALVPEILTLTFTERAANEMKKRILDRFRELHLEGPRRDLEQAYISTIHAFASRLLKEHPLEAGLDPDFRVLESEESDLLKEKAIDQVIEAGCLAGDGTFEFLQVYSERDTRNGLLKIYHAARNEGKTLALFMEESRRRRESLPQEKINTNRKINALFEKLDQSELLREWNGFASRADWNSALLEEFRAWRKTFSKKGGKNDKEIWKELQKTLERYEAWTLEEFLQPWREKMERLAAAFEAAYETAKREEAVLDFDDLQSKALELFTNPAPMNQKLLQRYRKIFRFIMVDEFQDTNAVQTRLIEMLSSGNNLFFVGDFKQSIYGFRGTTPAFFAEKEEAYRKNKEGAYLSLNENFRTEEPLLEFINQFFGELWKEDDFAFENLKSKAGISYKNIPVEVLRISLGENEEIDRARIREARAVAKKIKDLNAEGFRYGDIAILFSAMTASPIYEQALRAAGVPYFVVAGRGFYHQPEIRDMVSFLSCLENPLSDIALAATLRAPFFQVADDTLFWLARRAKADDEERPFYYGFLDFEHIEEIPAAEKEKLRLFKTTFEELSAAKNQLRLTELIDHILRKTAYELYALAHPQGVRQYANLMKLADLAREYESREVLGLGDFIRRLRRFENREVRESEAQIQLEEGGDSVRLMTIHQAKGLEFPAVFLADLGRERQSMEGKTVVAEGNLGYGLKFWNEKTLEKEEPYYWQEIEAANDRREKEERKRLLYVAMTRAKKKLILSGVSKERKKEKASFHDRASWMDWVQALEMLFPAKPGAEEDLLSETEEPKPDIVFDLKSGDSAAKPPKEIETIWMNIQPREKAVSRVADLPVSAYAAFRKAPAEYRKVYLIGYRSQEEPKKETLPEEAETTIRASDFGTAMHLFMERLNLKHPEPHAARLFKDVFRGMDDAAQEEARKITAAFLRSPLLKRLQSAKRVFRELPFVLNERHGRIDGVIDAAFEDAEGWHVLDYKTAIGDEAKVKAAGYDLQIQMYALALRQILGVVPKTGLLYFFKNQWTYALSLDAKKLEGFQSEVRDLQEAILNSHQF